MFLVPFREQPSPETYKTAAAAFQRLMEVGEVSMRAFRLSAELMVFQGCYAEAVTALRRGLSFKDRTEIGEVQRT